MNKMCEFFAIPVCECHSETGPACTSNYSLSCQWANERRKEMGDIIEGMEEDVLEEQKPLHEFYVAGVKFHKLHTCIKEIEVGDSLIMRSEPTNKHDPNAVRLEFFSEEQDKEIFVGYVPAKISASVTADLIINPLLCIVTEVNPDEKTWLQLRVAIIGGTHV